MWCFIILVTPITDVFDVADVLDSTLEGETYKLQPSSHRRSAMLQDGACIRGNNLVAGHIVVLHSML
jgi:hypothetical protein